MKLFKNIFKRKPSLRDRCVVEYSEMCDAINRGERIGGLLETVTFLDKLEKVRKNEID